MEEIELCFTAPSELNQLQTAKNKEGKPWSYSGVENSSLILNPMDWVIRCEANGKQASIADWMVDEQNYGMKLREDEQEGNFVELDYSFAVSMLGQLCENNTNMLKAYLDSLLQVFSLSSGKETNTDDLTKIKNK